MRPDTFTWLWIAWGAAFLVIEAAALAAGHGTLSAHIWYLLDRYQLARMAIFALFGWLLLHFFIDNRVAALKSTALDDGLVILLSALIGARTRRK